jgi:glycerol-3-phosphate cytidylyltransferase-like family protein
MEERIRVLEGVKYIDKIIPNAPLIITKEYIELHKIDIICIPNNITETTMKSWLEFPCSRNMVRKINYTDTISTTNIIERILKQNKGDPIS